MSGEFHFLDPGELMEGELRLVLAETGYKGPAGERFPFYRFEMVCVDDGRGMGRITLRIGDPEGVLRYPGHVGFDVVAEFRGRRYAERSTRLLMPFVRRHGLREIWIGCSEDNAASRRTCERLGGVLLETIAVPKGIDLYEQGMRVLCRYRITVE